MNNPLIELFMTHSWTFVFLFFLSANDANETNGIRTQTNKENNKYNNDKILISNGIQTLFLLYLLSSLF
jgi:hypothetical protein